MSLRVPFRRGRPYRPGGHLRSVSVTMSTPSNKFLANSSMLLDYLIEQNKIWMILSIAVSLNRTKIDRFCLQHHHLDLSSDSI
ncbi:hypothetical protein BpHYR1_003561 [Brachionus plicatilis]|uniref:Uncharacterized protein n=1 Tax=Brachionus plicatilis TaxID=10195 RepID=A0A3M7QD80_BRAPC|nr:hypothetical protein BpHYR1_003561 [Brachionus plicatilis]